MTLIQIFLSGSSIGLNLGMNQGFYRRLKTQTNGWYKEKLYFSEVKLEDTEQNILSLLEFTEIVKELASIKKKDYTKVRVRVTDVITGEVTLYDSMCSVSAVVGIDHKGIRNKSETSKLYKRRYKFEILDF